MAEDGIRVHGFYRLRISEGDGEAGARIVGDSGWCQNQITNEGFDDFLCRLVGKQASSKQVEYVGLGTGTAPNATHTGLAGEIMSSTQKKTANVTVSGSKTLQFTATFYSSDSFLSATATLQNMGLFDASGTAAVLMAGNTYTTSSCATNQNVNITYALNFA